MDMDDKHRAAMRDRRRTSGRASHREHSQLATSSGGPYGYGVDNGRFGWSVRMGGAPAHRETRLWAALDRRDDLAGRRQPQPCRLALVRLPDQPLDVAHVTRRRPPDAATFGLRT